MNTGEGDILKGLIKSKGLSQEQFAVMLGTTRVTVSSLTKRTRISEDWKLRIINALHISKDVFTSKKFDGEGEEFAITDPNRSEELMNALGHESFKTTEHYLKDILGVYRR